MTLRALSPLGIACGEAHAVDVPAATGVSITGLGGGECLLCTAAVDARHVLHDLSAALGIRLPEAPGRSVEADGRWAIWLSPRSWLASVAPGEEEIIAARVAERFPDRIAHASPYGDALCWLSISGSGAEDLLRQGGFLSLEPGGIPVGHAKRTPIADIPVLVWRRGETRWHLAVERSRAAWLVDWARSRQESRLRA